MKSVHSFLFLVLLAAFNAAAQETSYVTYDRSTDTISMKEATVSLEALLRDISVRSGVEIRLDPQEEREVMTGFHEETVTVALERLARQYHLNRIAGYAKDASGESQLVSFSILREGDMSAAGLPPLVDPQFEALAQLRRASERGDSHTGKRAWQRWQARFSQLPPQVRAQLQERAEEKLERDVERMEASRKRQEEGERKRAEKLAHRSRNLEQLEANDPERYELRMQRRAELEAKAKDEAERRREANLSAYSADHVE